MSRYINPYTDFGFKKLDTAELAALNAEQRRMYETNLLQYWGMKSAIDTAVEESKIEIAKNGILKGYENNVIADLTNLTVEQIEKLRSKLSQ